jgi:Zn-dependent metalloprotease
VGWPANRIGVQQVTAAEYVHGVHRRMLWAGAVVGVLSITSVALAAPGPDRIDGPATAMQQAVRLSMQPPGATPGTPGTPPATTTPGPTTPTVPTPPGTTTTTTTTTTTQPSVPQTPAGIALEYLDDQTPASIDATVDDELIGATGERLVVAQFDIGGIPVLGAQAVVAVDDTAVTMSNTRPPSTPQVTTTATILAANAAGIAVTHIDTTQAHTGTLTTTTPQQVIIDPVVLGLEQPERSTLTWSVSVADQTGLTWKVYVNATTGDVVWSYRETAEALDRRVCRSTTPTRCDQPQRAEGTAPTGDVELDNAYDYAGDAYGYFHDRFGLDSYDGNGAPIRATVGVAGSGAMARLDGLLWFASGYAVDDVVAHEYTHLMLFNIPSGGLLVDALGPRTVHEGLADVFGELVDLNNGAGNDSRAVRWLVGEDLNGVAGFPRSMEEPANENRAARVGDTRWVHSGDWRGAYQNMGVITRLAPMLVDGDNVRVTLGENKTAQLMYAAAQSLTRAADVAEFARQLTWACTSFADNGTHGITPIDCEAVDDALAAIGLAVVAPAHPMNARGYIARDPSTGRSLLVSGGQARIIGTGELFNCLAASRVVWDIPEHVTFLFETGVWEVQLSCFDAGPRWQYAPAGHGGNITDGLIVRDTTTPGRNWLIGANGALTDIADGGTYLCLSRTSPVVWNVPDNAIASWNPVAGTAASCGTQARFAVTPQRIGGLDVFDSVDAQLNASGGTAPYTWELITPANLGVTVTANGRLQGNPTRRGQQILNLEVTDAAGATARLNVVMAVGFGPAPPITGDVRRLTFGNDDSDVVAMAADGSSILIRSQATNLTADPTEDGRSHLYVITTDTGNITRVTPTDVGGLHGYAMAVDTGDVYFSFGDDWRTPLSRRWNSATGTLDGIPALVNATIRDVSSDGSRIVWTTRPANNEQLHVTDVATGTTAALATDPNLVYTTRGAKIDPDGRQVAYVAVATGSNLVPFIRIATLSAPGTNVNVTNERGYTQQSQWLHSFSADGTRLSFDTYHGVFNGGQGILTVSNGSVQRLGTRDANGQVYNNVFDGKFAPAGQCMLVGSYEPDDLTVDLPNRGLIVYFTEWFTYNLTTSTYRRVTNTYLRPPENAAVSNNCSMVAVAASQYAVEPHDEDDHAGPAIVDIYITNLD